MMEEFEFNFLELSCMEPCGIERGKMTIFLAWKLQGRAGRGRDWSGRAEKQRRETRYFLSHTFKDTVCIILGASCLVLAEQVLLIILRPRERRERGREEKRTAK